LKRSCNLAPRRGASFGFSGGQPLFEGILKPQNYSEPSNKIPQNEMEDDNNMRKILAVCIAMVMILMGFSVTPSVSAHTEDEPFVTDLIAGGGNPKSAIDAGDILIWNDKEYLYVEYMTEGTWVITETHLDVELDADLIPQKNGNPRPGHFEFNTVHDPPVTEYTYVIELLWEPETQVYIAAHAVVLDSAQTITEIELTNWGRSTESPYHIAYSYSVGGAVSAGFNLPIDPYQVVWNDGQYSSHPPQAGIDYATWKQWYSSCGAPYETRHFTASVELPGEVNLDHVDDVILYSPYRSGDILPINDNIYVRLNGNDIGHKGVVYGASYTTPRSLIPGSDGWYVPGSFPMGAMYLQSGTNQFDFVTEETCSWGGMERLEMKVAWHQEETGWGAGPDFPGKNWAMYIEYEIQEIPDIIYFPGPGPEGNAYIGYEDRAGGDFDYNDFGMNMYVMETYVGGYLREIYLEFTAVINRAGDVHDIYIERAINGDFDYSIYRSDTYGTREVAPGTYSDNGELEVILFDTARWPNSYWQVMGQWIVITVTIPETNTLNPYVDPGTITPPRWDLNPIFAFYDPFMVDRSIGYAQRHIENTQYTTKWGDAYPGIEVPYILVVPYTNWPAPGESVTVTGPYPYFDEYYRTKDSTYSNWFIPSP
jgi:hypothetical protein